MIPENPLLLEALRATNDAGCGRCKECCEKRWTLDTFLSILNLNEWVATRVWKIPCRLREQGVIWRRRGTRLYLEKSGSRLERVGWFCNKLIKKLRRALSNLGCRIVQFLQVQLQIETEVVNSAFASHFCKHSRKECYRGWAARKTFAQLALRTTQSSSGGSVTVGTRNLSMSNELS